MKRRNCGLFASVLSVTLLCACTVRDVGQTVYNTGESWCRQDPRQCDARPK